MIPRQLLARAKTPEGGSVILARENGSLRIRVDGQLLMASSAHGSEEAMAVVACDRLRATDGARVLVAGLGLGYTLRAVLDRLPATATVVCYEIVPAIVEWHSGPLGPLAGHPLGDPRVELVVGDVVPMIETVAASGSPAFDAILIDVDNGPTPLTMASNWWLYATAGLKALGKCLAPGGTLVVWSALRDDLFADRMVQAGLTTEVRRVAARAPRRGRRRRGGTHILFVGRSPDPSRAMPGAINGQRVGS